MAPLFWLLMVFLLISTNALRHNKKPQLLMNKPIVGGEDAQIINFPYQISFGFCRKNEEKEGSECTYRHFCGGSIISVEWVLTAAHCADVTVDRPLNEFRVRAGSHLKSEGGYLHEIFHVVIHPNYSEEAIDYDVAVIQVKRPFDFGPTVQPIPLNKNPIVVGGIATASGWGTTTEGGDKPEVLQRVQIPIMSPWECRMLYGKEDKITDNMICVGRAGRSSCHGDSGGPVVYDGFQIGVVSWGYTCQRPNYPGVYANVYALWGWIHKVTGV